MDSPVEQSSRFPFSLAPLIAEAKRRARQRRVLIALAVLLLAGLAGGLTLALRSPGGGASGGGHLGAFKGIGAAQRAQTAADVLPPKILARIKQQNADPAAKKANIPPLRPETARYLGQLPDEALYVLANAAGDLCYVEPYRPPGSDLSAAFFFNEGCLGPFGRSRPIQMADDSVSGNYAGYLETIVGVAMDGVATVTFSVAGKAMTLPVKNNLFAAELHQPATNTIDSTTYSVNSSKYSIKCVVAHLADGSTVRIRGFTCPSGQ
jgi:hypothetical protein